MQPRVVDISHHNTVRDLAATAEAGIWGVIHKATQGRTYADPSYAHNRQAALAADLLWGAYHFNTSDPVAQQVDFFMLHANPDEHTCMVLDFEDYRPSNMSMAQAVEFLHLLEEKLGRKGAIYSGNRLKECLGSVPAADQAYLAEHRLWLCQYGPHAVLPHMFKAWWLWQYTGDGVGMGPHTVPGISAGNGGLDLNAFNGTRDDLEASWAGQAVAGVTVSPQS